MKKFLICICLFAATIAALSLTSCKKESKGSDVVDIYTPYISDFTCRYYTMSGEKIEDKETYFAHDAEIRVKIDFIISSEAYKAGKNKFTVAFVLPTGFTGRIVSANTSTISNRDLSATFATGDKSKNCSVEAVIVFNYVSGRLRFGCSYDDESQREDGGEPLNCAEPLKFTKYGSVYQVDREGYRGDKVESLDIPQTFDGYPVTIIGDYAFSHFKELKRITIPLGISYIGAGAFYGCSSLESAIIPDSVTGIGYHAFDNCDSLKFNEYNNAFYLGNDANPRLAFIKSNNTTHVDIPDTTRVICSGAFKNRSDIDSVTIGKGITVIPNSAFSGSSLRSLNISDNLTRIGDNAFNGCRSLIAVTIPIGVTSIGDDVFSGCDSLTNITVNEGNNAYRSIDGNLYTVDGTVLLRYAAGKLDTTYKISDEVLNIADSAFNDCDRLKNITIGNGVTEISRSTFKDCSNLTTVTIGNGVTAIGDAFGWLGKLTNITVSEGNAKYKSINGNLYTKDGKTLVRYAAGKSDSEFVISDTVTDIGEYAFNGCGSLTSVVISVSITSIGWYSFYGCVSLKSIIIPDSVTNIGIYAFYNCDGLTSITIPSSVEYIGGYAFSECDGLTNVTIFAKSLKAGERAFGECGKLKSVTFVGTKEEWLNLSSEAWKELEIGKVIVKCSDGEIKFDIS